MKRNIALVLIRYFYLFMAGVGMGSGTKLIAKGDIPLGVASIVVGLLLLIIVARHMISDYKNASKK